MWMWIILGSLIGVVAIFLIFTGLMDRKRTKRLKIKNRQLAELRKDATSLIAIWVSIVIEHNSDALSRFIPSIGHFKMKDIRESAKKSLNLLINKTPYQLIKDSDDLQEKEVKQKLHELLHSSSNNWMKNHLKTIDFFQKLAKTANENEKNQVFYQEAHTTIKGVYDEFCQ